MSSSSTSRGPVLIAEDDLVTSRILERHLKTWGYAPVSAFNGRQAWKALQDPEIRLVLLDWMMPGLSGLELCRRVRNLAKSAYTYVILLTGRDQTEDIITGLEAGADDYMTKPVNYHELRARLQTGRRIIALEDRLVESRERLTEMATRDNVTLGWNRAAILKFLADEIDRGGRRKRPTGAILIDVDFFKVINDTYGHLAGDKALQALTAGLEANVRSYDKVGRYGGDEILVVLPDCDQVQVGRVAERIRQAAAKLRVRAGKKTLRLTLSMGCASTQGQARPSVDGLIRAADRALYMAKDAGRDRFVCAPPRSSVKTAKGMSHGRKKK